MERYLCKLTGQACLLKEWNLADQGLDSIRDQIGALFPVIPDRM